MSKEYDKNDKNLEISKIHHKRKEEQNVNNIENRHENKIQTKILAIGSIISILILLISITATAAVTEIGSSRYNSFLKFPPNKNLYNNIWGALASEKDSGSLKSYIFYKSDYSSFGWEWSRSPGTNSYVNPIYPEIMMDSYSGFTPIKYSNVNSLTAELQYSYPKSPTGDYNLAHELWFEQGGSKKAEIMFWLTCVNQCEPGTYLGETSDGINTYSVYYRAPASSHNWLFYAFILKNRNPIQYNHKIDMKALLNYLSGKLSADWNINAIELGTEIWRGSGRIEISKYNVNLNGPATSSPTPTATAPTPTATAPTPTATATVPAPTPTVTTTPTTPISTTNSIILTTPNGGESWKQGSRQTIKWSSAGSPGKYVKIELLKSGKLSKVISSYTLNDGSYNWIIPFTQTIGTDYKIRITSSSNSAYTDMSNSNFGISKYGW